MSRDTKTGGEHTTAVGLDRPSPYRIPIERGILRRTAVEPGTTVALELTVTDRFLRLVCVPATDDDTAVTRRLDARSGEDRPHLTLPKAAIEAGGFVGRRALPYAEADDDRLFVGLDRPSGLADVALTETETARLSRYRGGELVVSVGDSVAGPLGAAEELACWFDHADGQPVFVFGVPAVAPADAIERTPNPNTGREAQPGLSVYFPRLLARLCAITGGRLRWGRTADGNRLLGVPVDA